MFLASLLSENIFLKQSTIVSLDLRECPDQTVEIIGAQIIFMGAQIIFMTIV